MSVLRAIAVFLVGFFRMRYCDAQITYPGLCPDVSVKADFNPIRYTGMWYEIEKYFSIFEFAGRCVTAEYVDRGDGIIGVINRQINILTGAKSEIEGEATQVSRSDEGKLSVRFPSLPINIAAPYWVVDTDYDSYSVVWTCYDFGIFHTRNVWILTRDRHPELATLEKAVKVVEKNNLDKMYLIRTDQTNCVENEY